MFEDARRLAHGSEIAADICIVGAGPAGLALAEHLAQTSLKIVVLESGGDKPTADSNDLSKLASDSVLGRDLAVGADRAVGGVAHAWSVDTGASHRNVRLTPMTEADFEARTWMEESGWPITAADLAPSIARAKTFFELPEADFTPAAWTEPEAAPLPIPESRIRTRMFMFANATTVLERARSAVERSAAVALYRFATAIELVTSPDASTVVAVRAQAPNGVTFNVRAGQVVLTGGGLGVTKLLCASDAVVPGGLGNASGHLGRHFNTHPLIYGGKLYPAARDVFAQARLYDIRERGGGWVMGHLQLTDAVLREEPVLNMSAMLFPEEADADAHRALSPRQLRAFDASTTVRNAIRNRQLPRLTDLLTVATGVDGVLKRLVGAALWPKSHMGKGGWSRLPHPERRYHCFSVYHVAEQGPHPDCRVELSNERDVLGQRRLRVLWRLTDEDAEALVRSQYVFKEELERAGIGRYDIASDNGRPFIIHPTANHFMGLTRMSKEPADGVVDVDGRVHGVRNLYVASASVFPTGGFANPTLLIVALAYRTADVLLERARELSPPEVDLAVRRHA